MKDKSTITEQAPAFVVQVVDRHRWSAVTRYREAAESAATAWRREGLFVVRFFRCEAVSRLSWPRPCYTCEVIAAVEIEAGRAFAA